MLVKSTNTEIVGTPAQSRLDVRAEDVRKIVSLMIQKYQSRVTPIREVVINALETTANAVANGREFCPVELSLNANAVINGSPFMTSGDEEHTYEDAVITITDHGEGMSPEFMTEMFSSLGASTKDQDEDAIGGFGIGSKSVLSLTDYATWRTVKDGQATVMIISTDNVDGFAVNTATTDTDEDNGTTVTVPVSSDIMGQIVRSLSKEFLDYVPSDKVIVTGNLADSMTVGAIVDNISHSTSNGVDFIDSSQFGRGTVHIMVNGAPYPLPDGVDHKLRGLEAEIEGGRLHKMSVMYKDIIVNLDQNDDAVVILGSRESLVNSDELVDVIVGKVQEAINEVANDIVSKITSLETTEGLFEVAKEISQSDIVELGIVTTRHMFRWSRTYGITSTLKAIAGGDNNPGLYGNTIVDGYNGKIVSLLDVMDSDGELVSGIADISRPSSDGFGYLMNDWQEKINDVLILNTTENQAKALINAKSIKDIAGDDAPQFYTTSGDVVYQTIEPIIDMAIELDTTFNGMEPSDFANIVTTDIRSRIKTSEKTVDEVREDIKKTVRKINAAKSGPRRRRTREEKIADAPLHVMEFQEGKGYEVTEFFPSVPKLEKWIRDKDAHWIPLTDHNGYNREPVTMVTDESVKKQKTISESVSNMNLVLVVIRKDTLDNRVWDIGGNLSIGRYESFHGFIENAEDRAVIFKAQNEHGIEDEGVNANRFINSCEMLMVDNGHGTPLLRRIMDQFDIHEGYREIMEGMFTRGWDGGKNGWYISTDDESRISVYLPAIAHVFVEGDYMKLVANLPDHIINNGHENIEVIEDAVTILRDSVDMVSGIVAVKDTK